MNRRSGIAKDSATTKPELAVSPDEAGSSWSGEKDTLEARPPEIAQHSALTESALAAAATAVAKSARSNPAS